MLEKVLPFHYFEFYRKKCLINARATAWKYISGETSYFLFSAHVLFERTEVIIVIIITSCFFNGRSKHEYQKTFYQSFIASTHARKFLRTLWRIFIIFPHRITSFIEKRNRVFLFQTKMIRKKTINHFYDEKSSVFLCLC